MQFNKFSLGILCCFLVWNLNAQQFPSMNNHQLIDSVSGDFSFLVGGHFYGSAAIKNGIPASTVLANMESMNASGASFLAHVGDIFSNVKKDIPATKKVFLGRLKFPVFNAVGDHDLSSTNNIYQETFGKPYFSFSFKENTFLFLDTDSDDSSIKGEQLDLFKESINKLGQKSNNIFIFSHRPIWSENDEQLEGLFVNNDHSSFGCNYEEELLPILKTVPSQTKIYWFSGSIGASRLASFYHAKNEQLHFIQTAVKDTPRDAMLKVSVSGQQVNIEAIPLTEGETENIEKYNLDYWQKHAHKAEPFKFGDFINQLKNMLVHRYFWFGAGLMFVGNLFLLWFIGMIKQKRSS